MNEGEIFFNSFIAGEITPWAHGRQELDQYKAGCKTKKNVIGLPYGGTIRRPGTSKVGDIAYTNTGDFKAAKFIPFVFSSTDNMMLVILENKLYYFTSDNTDIVYTGIDNIPSFDDPNDLSFKQVNDVIFVAHKDFPPGEIRRTSKTPLTFEYITPLLKGPFKSYNIDPFSRLKLSAKLHIEYDENIHPREEIAIAYNDLQWLFPKIGAEIKRRVVKTDGNDIYYETGFPVVTSGISPSFNTSFIKDKTEFVINFNAIPNSIIDPTYDISLAGKEANAIILPVVEIGPLESGQDYRYIWFQMGEKVFNNKWEYSYSHLLMDTLATPLFFFSKIKEYYFNGVAYSSIDLLLSAHKAFKNYYMRLTSNTPLFSDEDTGSYVRLAQKWPKLPIFSRNVNGAFIGEAFVVGSEFQMTTYGGWSGTLKVRKSSDGGNTWLDLAEFYNSKFDSNYTETFDNLGDDNLLVRVELLSDFVIESSTTSPGVRVHFVQLSDPTDCIVKIGQVSDSYCAYCTMVNTSNSMDQTSLWSFGSFSTKSGYPLGVDIFDERLVYIANTDNAGTIYMSEVNNWNNFILGSAETDAVEFGIPSQEQLAWVRCLDRIYLGTGANEWIITSSEKGKIISSLSREIKIHTERGSKVNLAVSADDSVLFIDRIGQTMYEMTYNFERDKMTAPDLSIFAEHLFRDDEVIQVVKQKTPFTIIWNVMKSGRIIGLTYNRAQGIIDFHQHFIGSESDPLRNGNTISLGVLNAYSNDDMYICSQRDGVASFMVMEPIYNPRFYLDNAEKAIESPWVQPGEPKWMDWDGEEYSSVLETLPVPLNTDTGTGFSKMKNISEINLDVVDTGQFYVSVNGGKKELALIENSDNFRSVDGNGQFVYQRSGMCKINPRGSYALKTTVKIESKGGEPLNITAFSAKAQRG